MTDVAHLIVAHNATLRECVRRFAETKAGIAIFVDDQQRFYGLLTAGDLFRLLAAGVALDNSVQPHINTNPTTVTPEFTDSEILRLMSVKRVSHIPVLRSDRTIERIVLQAALLNANILRNRAVIMAGGDGTRLRPLTSHVPKGLVKVNGKSLLELLIERLRDAGILDITICLRYLADHIRQAIGDGSAWHVNVRYIEEPEPLGTCGALSLIQERWREPFFVINCDVLSDIDLVRMHQFHTMQAAQFTVAVKDHEFEVPFGIVEVDHERVLRLSEKPRLKFYVNAGIYLLEPDVPGRLQYAKRCDMTELIALLLQDGVKVCSFPIRTRWLDVGDMENLRHAQNSIPDDQIIGS